MRRLLTGIIVLFASLPLLAQNVSDLIIAEALAQPDSIGIVDGYGRRSGWIELYNTSTGTVNFGGCFLTDTRDNLKKSLIPKTDLSTKLGPRQSVVFFCSGNGADGTFYAGFTLEPGKTVYLVSNDGRTVIDSLSIPTTLPAGMSVQKTAKDLRQKVFTADPEARIPSPGSINGNVDSATKAQNIAVSDPHGFTLTIVSVSVVFCALAILWFLFWLFFDRPAKAKAKAQAKPQKKAKPAQADEEVAAAIALALDMENGGDTYAAIAAAVHLYLTQSVHDTESGVITIVRKDSKWTDKTRNFRILPR